MRTLVLLRGIQASGKSTWVKEHKLEDYTLSSDHIRSLFNSPVLSADGTRHLNEEEQEKVWKTFRLMLETRMEKGEFIVVDSTNITRKDVSKYVEASKRYKYRIFGIDFTDISVSEAKRRNKEREKLKRVPEYVIDKFYDRLIKEENFPKEIVMIKPNEFDKILLHPINLNKYNKIHHIGDIHGCYTALMEYLKDGLKDDEYYIFLGDYIDRGIQNAKVINYLMEISEKENVLLLEGNHEKWLKMWADNKTTYSSEFENNTKKDLAMNRVKSKLVKRFCRKLAQCAYYEYNNKTFFVSHGGVSTIPKNPLFISAYQMIHGVGSYEDVIKAEETFDSTMPENMYQIHGHRNFDYPIHSTERNYNLEGKIELGGHLRIVEVSKEGINEVEIKNTVFRKPENDFSTVHEALKTLRKDDYIKEKTFGNISSFNFSRKAFNNRVWNERTVTARGLYINTKTEEIVCRGYNKFFAVDEVEETKYSNLKRHLVFPVTAYVKENGFLGMVSLNRETNDLFITTKSDPTGIAAKWLREMFYKKMSEEKILDLKKYLANSNETFVFECVDKENNPHIIDYNESNLYLLDVIKNEFNFKKKPYHKLKELANKFGFIPKELAFEFNNLEEFDDWYAKLRMEDMRGEYKYKENYIEGFVLEDSNQFMFKLKLNYYRKWKYLRGLLENINRIDIYALDEEEREFVKFVKELLDKEIIHKDDMSYNICNLRKLYKENRGKNI